MVIGHYKFILITHYCIYLPWYVPWSRVGLQTHIVGWPSVHFHRDLPILRMSIMGWIAHEPVILLMTYPLSAHDRVHTWEIPFIAGWFMENPIYKWMITRGTPMT